MGKPIFIFPCLSSEEPKKKNYETSNTPLGFHLLNPVQWYIIGICCPNSVWTCLLPCILCKCYWYYNELLLIYAPTVFAIDTSDRQWWFPYWWIESIILLILTYHNSIFRIYILEEILKFSGCLCFPRKKKEVTSLTHLNCTNCTKIDLNDRDDKNVGHIDRMNYLYSFDFNWINRQLTNFKTIPTRRACQYANLGDISHKFFPSIFIRKTIN